MSKQAGTPQNDTQGAGSPSAVVLSVDGSVEARGDVPNLERISKPVDSAVNLRDVHDAVPARLRQGVLFRSSQLVTAEELKQLSLKAVLDLRTVKKGCKKIEKDNLQAQEIQDDTFTKKRFRTRLTASRKAARGLQCKSCRICSAAFSQKYGVLVPVFHSDFIPTKTGLKIMGSVPRTTAALAILRICICQHPQQTMAPATADSDQLGVAGLYCLILDNSKDQVGRALRLWTHQENLPILVHCIHGKDRTGLVIALLLFLIDVPIEQVVADYEQSEQELVANREEGNLHLDAGLKQDVMLSSRAAAVHTVDAHLRTQYGGIRRYCLEAGLSEEEITRIRANLMPEPPSDANNLPSSVGHGGSNMRAESNDSQRPQGGHKAQ